MGGQGRGAAGLAVAAALATALGGCFNSGPNTKVSGGSNRLQLVVETGRTDLDGTHFLVDTATGDLWRLAVPGTGAAHWVRVSDGPDDLRELTPEDLGVAWGLPRESRSGDGP